MSGKRKRTSKNTLPAAAPKVPAKSNKGATSKLSASTASAQPTTDAASSKTNRRAYVEEVEDDGDEISGGGSSAGRREATPIDEPAEDEEAQLGMEKRIQLCSNMSMTHLVHSPTASRLDSISLWILQTQSHHIPQ